MASRNEKELPVAGFHRFIENNKCQRAASIHKKLLAPVNIGCDFQLFGVDAFKRGAGD